MKIIDTINKVLNGKAFHVMVASCFFLAGFGFANGNIFVMLIGLGLGIWGFKEIRSP